MTSSAEETSTVQDAQGPSTVQDAQGLQEATGASPRWLGVGSPTSNDSAAAAPQGVSSQLEQERTPRLLGQANPIVMRKQSLRGQVQQGKFRCASFVHPDRHVSLPDTLKMGPPGCESINFDLFESQQYIEYVMRRSKWMGRLKGGFRWLFIALAGTGTGLLAAAIAFALHKVGDAKMHVQEWMTESGQSTLARYSAWAGGNLCLAAVAGLLVCFVEPLAAGSGIPEIKCYLNGIDRPRVLAWRTLLCKATGIIFSVAAGLPCGKEGPMIHSGAIIAALMARVNAGPLVSPYRENREARDLTAAGAAAGVAAAFGAPIGGVLFAVEEGASHMNPTILVRCFVCATVSACTVRVFLGPMDHSTSFGILGTDVPVEFGRFTERAYMVWELCIFATMGVLGGLLGAAFNQANKLLARWRQAHIGQDGWRRFVEVLVGTAVISTVNFMLPMLSGNSEMSRYGLSELLFVESGNTSIKRLFHSLQDYDLHMLLLFSVVHYFEACWTYGFGVPSGLFVPSLLAGAAWGRLVGQLLTPLERVQSHSGVFALVGASAALSGMARITISLAVILMETTGEAEWGLPIFVTAVAAKWTGDLFNKGLYDIHIQLKKVPLLEGHPEKQMLLLRASDIMSCNVVSLPGRIIIGDLLRVLSSCAHNGFPVIEPDTETLSGLIERQTLYQVLVLGRQHNYFQDHPKQGSSRPPVIPQEEMFRREFSDLHEVRASLQPGDYQVELDLRPYMNRGCLKVEEDTLLTRCYIFFRVLGVRHLPVVGEDRTVRGIITRKDLIFEEESEHSPTAQATAEVSSVAVHCAQHGAQPLPPEQPASQEQAAAQEPDGSACIHQLEQDRI